MVDTARSWPIVRNAASAVFVLCCIPLLLLGCSTDPAVADQREANALIDSVSALPTVPVYAPDDLARAKRSLAMADSLFDLDQKEIARMYYMEAIVHARIALVETETAMLNAEILEQSIIPE